MTATPLLSTDNGSTSRGVINANFAALDVTDALKVEFSGTVPVDGDLTVFSGITGKVIKKKVFTASQTLESDANGQPVSAAKGTAYNKNFGITSDTILEGNLAGTSGTPVSTSNKLVDNADTRLGSGGYLYGDGSDGVVTISSGTTTLTRDMYYETLTIQTGGIIDGNGFRIFVQGTLTFQGTGKIINNGVAGTSGTAGALGTNNGTGGAGGAAASTGGSLPDSVSGSQGSDGIDGAVTAASSAGTAGTAIAKSLGVAGSAGSSGGAGGASTGGAGGPGTAGAGGAAGARTGTVFNKINSIHSGYLLIDNQPTIVTLTGSSGSGGGSGGGGGQSSNSGDTGAGGGGGGSGSPGGFVWIAANTIITVDGNVYAESNGGNGGNGGAGGNSVGSNAGGGGGGGGGAGGSGGVVIVFYNTKTGTGTVSVTGGTGGTGGAFGTRNGAGNDGTAGTNGTNGNAGTSYEIEI